MELHYVINVIKIFIERGIYISLIGGYRASGVIASTSVSSSAGIINFTGFKPSGLAWGNILGVALYCWSGAYTQGKGGWIPVKNDMLK